MTKKEYIIALLSRLESVREMAGPFKMLIETTDVDDEFIDGLSALLMQAIHEVDDEVQKKKFIHSQELLKKLQILSSEDNIDDAELEKMLAAI